MLCLHWSGLGHQDHFVVAFKIPVSIAIPVLCVGNCTSNAAGKALGLGIGCTAYTMAYVCLIVLYPHLLWFSAMYVHDALRARMLMRDFGTHLRALQSFHLMYVLHRSMLMASHHDHFH